MAGSHTNWMDEMSDDNEDWPKFPRVLMRTRSVPAGNVNFETTFTQPMITEASNSMTNVNVAPEEPMCLSEEETKPQPPGTGSGSVVQSGRNRGRGFICRGSRTRYRSNAGINFGFSREHGRNENQRGRGNPFRGDLQSNVQSNMEPIRGIRARGRGDGSSSRSRRGRGDRSRGRGNYTRGRGMNLALGLGPEQGIQYPFAIIDPVADERIMHMMNDFSLLYIANPMFPPNNSEQN